MGMYTEMIFGARLRPDLPTKIEKLLKYMVEPEKTAMPKVLPEHNLFKCERWTYLFTCGSYYFGIHRPHAILEWDDVSNSYSLSVRSSIKNYDGEIAKFLDWIKPYLQQGSGNRGMYAVTCYEEDDVPTMHFLEDKDSDEE
jgi:hypothetical protein